MMFFKIGKVVILSVVSLLIISNNLKAQAPVNYNDVAIICNNGDTAALSLAKYFMSKRAIPSNNLILFQNSKSAEVIDSSTFDEIRTQIEDSLKGHKISNKVNYLVTIGCPLKVSRATVCDASDIKTGAFITCAAFDNELMLILSKNASMIGKGDVFDTASKTVNVHNYYKQRKHFSRAKFDMYLVTRLYGANYKESRDLIDRQGPNSLVDKSKAIFVIDDFKASDTFINRKMTLAANMLKARKWNVNYDTSNTFVQKQSDVLGYCSWGFTDPAGKVKTIKGFPFSTSYTKAAIGVSFYSYNGYTLADNFSARSTFPRIVREGISGFFATVYEPFSFAFPMPNDLFDVYTDSTVDVNYNLAESYYYASPTVSWMGVVLGDPKTSIVTHIPPKPSPYCDTISYYIIGKSGAKNLYAGNISRGYWGWFKGDSSSLKKLNLQYDDNHPLLYSKTKKLTISDTTFPIGKHYFTFVNQNIGGTFYQQYEVNVSLYVGISDVISPHTISVSPNPVKDVLYLSASPSLENKKVNLTVSNLSGKVLLEQNIGLALNQSISLESLVQGMYVLKISDGKTNVIQKIIKE